MFKDESDAQVINLSPTDFYSFQLQAHIYNTSRNMLLLTLTLITFKSFTLCSLFVTHFNRYTHYYFRI